MFNSTIWVRHDPEASVHMHEDPMDRLRDRVSVMEHNLETLRTRVTQVADLQDAQGTREDHRAKIARLNEVEECATVHTLREFMSKIRRLEAMFTGEDGGAIFEAIRACNRRLDSHRDTMDDFYARISTQDWYHDISDPEGGEETENQPGIEYRSSGRQRLRGHAPQRRTMRQWTRTMPRPSPPSGNDAPPTQDRSPTIPPEMMQQAIQRLFVAYNQCVHRVAQTDDRMEQFRSNLRRDALELALNVQRIEQDVQHQYQATSRIKETLFDDVQERVKSLEERLRHVMDHEMHVNQTIDTNTHSQGASMSAIIDEQGDVRKLAENLASRLDRSQEVSSATQSANVLLEINDLRSKVCRLTEQSTKLDGDVSFLSKLSEQVELLENQVVKWRYRLPELTDDESQEKIVSAIEVREELDEFKDAVYRKLKEILTSLNTLRESVRLIENDREESWEAISHKVSTLVEDSVGSLTDRLTEHRAITENYSCHRG